MRPVATPTGICAFREVTDDGDVRGTGISSGVAHAAHIWFKTFKVFAHGHSILRDACTAEAHASSHCCFNVCVSACVLACTYLHAAVIKIIIVVKLRFRSACIPKRKCDALKIFISSANSRNSAPWAEEHDKLAKFN